MGTPNTDLVLIDRGGSMQAVDAWHVAPGLAVTRAIGAQRQIGKYVITHVPSGMRLREHAIFPNRRDAIRWVKAIANVAHWEWDAAHLLANKAAIRRRINRALKKAGLNPHPALKQYPREG